MTVTTSTSLARPPPGWAVMSAVRAPALRATSTSVRAVARSPGPAEAMNRSPGPSGGVVEPGQTITVRLNWNPSDFSGSVPDKTDVCVEIGSQISASLSQEHKPGPPGGSDTYRVEVPAGGTGGQPICVRGSVSGTGHDGEKSAILCYTLLANPAPEVPQVLLLPLTALLVGGGALLFAWRRRTGKRLRS